MSEGGSGVAIFPGDILFGNRDGIIAASESEISLLVTTTEEIQQKEEIILPKLKQSKSLTNFLSFDEHISKVQ